MKPIFVTNNESYVRNGHKGGGMLKLTYPMSVTNCNPRMVLPTIEVYCRMTLLARCRGPDFLKESINNLKTTTDNAEKQHRDRVGQPHIRKLQMCAKRKKGPPVVLRPLKKSR
jgi:hypothetical protein